ncbi:hypothetical protein [Runella salmonicolor]|uniref:Lipocalin-like domain-containing protein n=1 Tax=Runella salmonicolor TaxID=2950278 RepID=A0ABT1FGR1_9BACT|nr:hypothetical protein [Runella salmonicolor]MCP1380922.1 hypothetical protein [Runella salmonicolor]
MKTTTAFVFILSFISCKPDYVKRYEKISGSWEFKQVNYVTKDEQKIQIQMPKYVVKFGNYSNREGLILINNKEFVFFFNAGPEECSIQVHKQSELPTEAIGKGHVYFYEFVDSKTLKFSIDREYDNVTKEVIKEVEYIFSKL